MMMSRRLVLGNVRLVASCMSFLTIPDWIAASHVCQAWHLVGQDCGNPAHPQLFVMPTKLHPWLLARCPRDLESSSYAMHSSLVSSLDRWLHRYVCVLPE